MEIALVSDDSRVSELLRRWQEHRDKGQTLSPEQLCVGCPELHGEVRRQLDAVRWIEGMRADIATGAQSSATEATAQADAPLSEHDASLTEFLAPPQADDELGRLGKYRIL